MPHPGSLHLGQQDGVTLTFDPDRRLEVLAMGAALIDVLEQVDATFPGDLGLRKGVMTLVDPDRARQIYAAMGETRATSGGSAANTITALARLGARTGFAGKTVADRFGEIFLHDLRAAGVEYRVVPTSPKEGFTTGRVLVLVTPDGERTMCTELGAAQEFGPEDVTAAGIETAAAIYLESYLLEGGKNRAAFLRAVREARAADTRIALSLSDPGCVERHRDLLLELVGEGIDVLFANEEEILVLLGTSSHAEAVEAIRPQVGAAALTRGAQGVVALCGAETAVVPAEPVTDLVDTTGAGDMFAAGFLYGLLRGRPLDQATRMGGVMAAEVLAHLGSRSQSDPKSLLAGHGW